MKKILSLLSLLAISSTTVTTVVACSNETPPFFDFSQAKVTLSDGTINVLGYTVKKTDKKLPDTIINDIKTALIIRLQDGTKVNNFKTLKIEDFTLTMKLSTNPSFSPLILKDEINDAKGLLNLIAESSANSYLFELTPNNGKKVVFVDTLTVRDYRNIKIADLLTEHSDKNPVSLFIKPSEVNQTNFKEIFWNAVLGESGTFDKQKDNFDLAISKDELIKLNNLKADNVTTVAVKVSLTIKNDFKTSQTGFAFTKGDKATDTAISFKTKLGCFDFSQIKEQLKKTSFNFEVKKGTNKLADAIDLIKAEIIKQIGALTKTDGSKITADDFTISLEGIFTNPFSILPIPHFLTIVKNDEPIKINKLPSDLAFVNPETLLDSLACSYTIIPNIGNAISFTNMLYIK